MAPLSHLVASLALGAAQAPASTGSDQRAIPDTARARREICYALAAGVAYPALNLVDCLNFDTAPDAVFKAQICNFLREADQFRDFGFSSYTDCIRRGPSPANSNI